jgi:CP family cyanate transporter-like MFS transporter
MEPAPTKAYAVLAAAFVLGFAVFDSLFVVSPMLALVMSEFALSFATAGLLFSVPIGVLVITSFLAGVLSDRLGPKKTAGIGALLLAIGSPARALSPNFVTLLVFSALIGATYGFLLPTFTKMMRGWFPQRLLGRVTGVYINGFYLGGAFAVSATIPLVLPLLAGWRETVLVTGAFAIVAAALWWIVAKEPAALTPRVSETTGVKRFAWLNRATVILALVMTIENIHFYALGTFLPTFLAEKGADTTTGGVIASLLLYAGILGNFLLPFLSDRVRRRKPFIWIGALVNGGAFVLLAPAGLLLQPLIVGTIGFTLVAFFAMVFLVAPELIEYAALGRAMGFIVSLGFVGGFIGPFLAGVLRDLSGDFSSLFIVEAALSLVVAALALRLPETWRVTPQPLP